jgi:hypothetical protein
VLSGGLPTITATLNPYNITTGGYSLYQNIKRLRFDLNREYRAVMFLEYIRMPALTNLSTCYKNLRVVGSQDIDVFDSTQGTTGNGILFTCEGGNTATNYFLSNTEYSRLPVTTNFLNKGYIEFELDTVLTAANIILIFFFFTTVSGAVTSIFLTVSSNSFFCNLSNSAALIVLVRVSFLVL